MPVGQPGQDLRANAVVLDRLGRIPLHHRHVLVGRCVKDHLGPMGGHDLIHPGRVGDVGDERLERGPWIVPTKLLLQEKEGVLSALDQQQFLGVEPEHLPADL